MFALRKKNVALVAWGVHKNSAWRGVASQIEVRGLAGLIEVSGLATRSEGLGRQSPINRRDESGLL